MSNINAEMGFSNMHAFAKSFKVSQRLPFQSAASLEMLEQSSCFDVAGILKETFNVRIVEHNTARLG